MQRLWRTIKDYPNYEVSNMGEVRRIRTTRGSNPAGYVMNNNVNTRGYVYISLSNGTKKACPKALHSLVAEAFMGSKPTFANSRTEINHIDGNKLNNRLDNLQYVSAKENKRHAIDTGLLSGVAGKKMKLNRGVANNMRELNRSGMRCCDIARQYGVRFSLVNDVLNNRCWR